MGIIKKKTPASRIYSAKTVNPQITPAIFEVIPVHFIILWQVFGATQQQTKKRKQQQ
jgi:hypothetical protein